MNRFEKARYLIAGVLLVCAINSGSAGNSVDHLRVYRQQGISETDQNHGRQLWNSVVNGRSCTSCHGRSPGEVGKHAKTGKPIQPMALSVNPGRYQDGNKIEKWFFRNCKWTLGRQCSLQEKADLLSWLSSL